MSLPTLAELRTAPRRLSLNDHAGTIRAHFPFWDTQIRPFLLHVVQALPVEQFDFKPLPGLMTAHQLVVHIAEGERGWLHHVVGGGRYEEWVVPRADPAQGFDTTIAAPDHAALFALLEEWHRPTQRWLDRPISDLGRSVGYQPEQGPQRRFTLHWILERVQEHEIHHRGQLVTYLRLMGVEPPPVF